MNVSSSASNRNAYHENLKLYRFNFWNSVRLRIILWFLDAEWKCYIIVRFHFLRNYLESFSLKRLTYKGIVLRRTWCKGQDKSALLNDENRIIHLTRQLMTRELIRKCTGYYPCQTEGNLNIYWRISLNWKRIPCGEEALVE